MRFAMLICGVEDEWNDQDAASFERAMDDIRSWSSKWHDAGKILPGGEELDSATKAKTIRPGTDGRPVVTDGPYLELKEVVGGVIFLEANDMDEAVAIAAEWPSLTGSSSVEVRPVIEN